MIGASIKAMTSALTSGDQTAEALLETHLEQIKSKDSDIGAFLSIDIEGARAQAREVDRKRAAGEHLGSLAGIPLGIKDNLNIKGVKTTCASQLLKDFVAPYSATVIDRLQAADAVLVGKTNLDEFAMGSSTEFSATQKTRNPVNLEHVPGGSSGGSAAAVAAGMVPAALGTSTGGSIRQPASFCGIVGLKPTYGRVSRYGLVAYGSSLDQIGPCAKDVDGVARLLTVIAGHDPRDATTSTQAVPNLLENLDEPPQSLRVGLVDEFASASIQPEVQQAMDHTVKQLQAAGAQIVPCSFPHTDYAIPAYYLIATAEASANLARFDGVRYAQRGDGSTLRELYERTRSQGFGPEVKRRILLGTYCLSSGYYEGYYLNAQKVRTKINADFQQTFENVDVILAPTSPTTAFKFGENTDDPVSMYLNDIFTVTANLAGVPALSLPAGKDQAGLPIGVQLMADHYREDLLLRAARWCEQLLT